MKIKVTDPRCVICHGTHADCDSERFQMMWAVGWQGEHVTMPLAHHAGSCWQVLEDKLERNGPFSLWTFNVGPEDTFCCYPRGLVKREDPVLSHQAMSLLKTWDTAPA